MKIGTQCKYLVRVTDDRGDVFSIPFDDPDVANRTLAALSGEWVTGLVVTQDGSPADGTTVLTPRGVQPDVR